MKNFLKKVGTFFKDNYWLQPLLLVALVFVLVFSLEGLESVSDTVKGWFDPYSTCKNAKKIKASEMENKLNAIQDGETIYVYYFDKETAKTATIAANEQLTNYIKAYNKDHEEDLVVYAVNYAIDEEVTYDEYQTTYKDTTMTRDFYVEIEEKVADYYDVEGTSGQFSAPTIVKYVYDATDKYVVDDVFSGTYSINTLKDWFNK